MESQHSNFTRFIIDFFTQDKIRKLIALLIALGLYLLISGTTGNDHVFNRVPLEIELPEALVNMDTSQPRIERVVLRGSDTILSRLNSGSLQAKVQVKMENYHTGAPYRLTISTDDIKSPFGTSVISVEPQVINLNLEAKTSKKIPIEAVFSGMDEMNSDFSVSKVNFNPAEVTVSGTESLLRELKYILTEPIPLKRTATESFDYQVKLQMRSGVTFSPESVMAFVEIVKENETKVIDAVPLSLLLPQGMEAKFNVELISAPNVTISLYGPRGRLALFQAKTLKAFADLTQLSDAGTYTVDVYCQPPQEEELSIKTVYPAQVQLKLTLKQK